jgi:enterochelin esterase-like enzyme
MKIPFWVACLWVFIMVLSKPLAGQPAYPKVSKGSIVRFADFQSKFVLARNIDVWLPDGYSSQKKYAVLYMHDGQMLFDSSLNFTKSEWGVDETMGRLMEEGKIPDCIVVGIWNTGNHRYGDYFPEKPFQLLTDAGKNRVLELGRKEVYRKFISDKPNSDNYLRFLTKELKPFIDQNFSTFRDKKHTFIAGSSMGGLISMYAVCEYPGIFSGAACLSTHWAGIFTNKDNPCPAAFESYLSKHLPRRNRFYVDHGTVGLDSLYAPHQKRMDAVAQKKGATHWTSKVFEGETHNEHAWKKRFHLAVLFLLEKS